MYIICLGVMVYMVLYIYKNLDKVLHIMFSKQRAILLSDLHGFQNLRKPTKNESNII